MSTPHHTQPYDMPARPVTSKFYSVAQGQALDRAACDMVGPFELMRQAGRCAHKHLDARWPEARHIVVLCGSGNNGGDGYVVATQAHRAGKAVTVYALTPITSLKGEAALAARMAEDAGVDIQSWSPACSLDADVIVDALLGTGMKGAVRAPFDVAIRAVNQAPYPVLSLDIPSGLTADTGAGETPIKADMTVTFITHKPGLYTGLGPDHVGDCRFETLGVDEALHDAQPGWGYLLQPDDLRRAVPPRLLSAHKGHCGHLLVVGGRPGFGGATLLSAEAAARVGAGKVSLATDAAHLSAALVRCPELMVSGVRNAHDIAELLSEVTAVSIGPGLGQGAWGEGLFDAVLEAPGPRLIDADALHLLKRQASGMRRDDWILTPHPGEAAMLLGCSSAEVQADRIAAAKALWMQWGGVIVLKGNGTLIACGTSEEELMLCPFGNPGMASGGMGDVLGGMIAGLLVQGLSPFDAAWAGVLVHALAADMAARSGGERGLLASDLASCARLLVNPTCE